MIFQLLETKSPLVVLWVQNGRAMNNFVQAMALIALCIAGGEAYEYTLTSSASSKYSVYRTGGSYARSSFPNYAGLVYSGGFGNIYRPVIGYTVPLWMGTAVMSNPRIVCGTGRSGVSIYSTLYVCDVTTPWGSLFTSSTNETASSATYNDLGDGILGSYSYPGANPAIIQLSSAILPSIQSVAGASGNGFALGFSNGMFTPQSGGGDDSFDILRYPTGFTKRPDLLITTLAAPTMSTPQMTLQSGSNKTFSVAIQTLTGPDDPVTSAWHAAYSVVSGPSGGLITVNSESFISGQYSGSITLSAVGDYTVRVTIRDSDDLSTTADVIVSVLPLWDSIEVSPPQVSLQIDGTYQFSAVAKKQGVTVSPPPIFSWSVPAGGAGTISGTGLFTATMNGNTVVTASGIGDSSISGTGTALVGIPLPDETESWFDSMTLNLSQGSDQASALAGTESGLPKASGATMSVDPIKYSNGCVIMQENDLDGHDNFSMIRSYGNVSSISSLDLGPGWMSGSEEYWYSVLGTDQVVVILDAYERLAFSSAGSSYTPVNDSGYRLQSSGTGLLLDSPDGTRRQFNGSTSAVPERNKLSSLTEPSGRITSYNYDVAGKLTQMTRSATVAGATTNETLWYTYGSGGSRLQSVILTQGDASGNGFTVRKAIYQYHASGSLNGTADTLKYVIIQDRDGQEIRRFYYRYFTGANQAGLLKTALGPRSCARLQAALGIFPDGASDTQLDGFADHQFTYHSDRKVSSHTVHAQGNDAEGVFTYAYTDNPTRVGIGQIAPNTWVRKTVETLPGNTSNNPLATIIYTNNYGQTLAEIRQADGKVWMTAYRFDSEYRETQIISPTAINSATWFAVYGGTTLPPADLLNAISGNFPYVYDSAGLIQGRNYYSSTTATASTAGGVAGRLYQTWVQQGETGTPVYQSSQTYFKSP